MGAFGEYAPVRFAQFVSGCIAALRAWIAAGPDQVVHGPCRMEQLIARCAVACCQPCNPQDRAIVSRSRAFGGFELLSASYVNHRFAPHWHPAQVFGVIESGAEKFNYRGSSHVAHAGSVVFALREKFIPASGWKRAAGPSGCSMCQAKFCGRLLRMTASASKEASIFAKLSPAMRKARATFYIFMDCLRARSKGLRNSWRKPPAPASSQK